MTVQEWLAGDPLWQMPDALIGLTSERKWRLLGCSICRHLWDLVTDARSRHAVEVVELYSEGNATRSELMTARRHANAAAQRACEHEGEAVYHAAEAVKYLTVPDGWKGEGVADGVGWALGAASHSVFEEVAHEKVMADLAAVFHCIFGNPFHPLTIDPAWVKRNDSTVKRLAASIYNERAFDRMPILADALEDACCTDSAILEHLRGPKTHVRGCWVVDLLLGKE